MKKRNTTHLVTCAHRWGMITGKLNYQRIAQTAELENRKFFSALVLVDFDSAFFSKECWWFVIECWVRAFSGLAGVVLEAHIATLYESFEAITNASMNTLETKTDTQTDEDAFARSVRLRFAWMAENKITPTQEFIVATAQKSAPCKDMMRLLDQLLDSGAQVRIVSQGWKDFIDAMPRDKRIEHVYANEAEYDNAGHMVGIVDGLLAHSGGKIELIKTLAAAGEFDGFDGFDAIVMIGDGSSDLALILALPAIYPGKLTSGLCWQMTAMPGSRTSVIENAIAHNVPVVATHVTDIDNGYCSLQKALVFQQKTSAETKPEEGKQEQ